VVLSVAVEAEEAPGCWWLPDTRWLDTSYFSMDHMVLGLKFLAQAYDGLADSASPNVCQTGMQAPSAKARVRMPWAR